MSKSAWRDGAVFKEWRWTHPDALVVAQARVRMAEMKSASWGRKAAVDWQSYAEIDGGFAVQWLAGATHKTAHHWLWQRVFPEDTQWKQSSKDKACRCCLFFEVPEWCAPMYAAWVPSGAPT